LIDVPENRTEGWMVVLNKNSGKDLSMNFLFCRSLRVASEILGALGDTSAASRYEELALKAEWAFDGLTGGSGVKGFSPELKCAASGSLDAFEAIESFFRNGKAEEGLRFIRENWGPMLDAGGGTFWEAPSSRPDHRVDVPADRFISESHCHGWTAGPTCALLSEVAGIKPTVPGFRSFEVKPLLGGLAFVKGVVPTPFGPIAVSLKKDGDGVEMVILVPEGCQAMVSLPSADGGHGAVEIKQAGMHTIRRR